MNNTLIWQSIDAAPALLRAVYAGPVFPLPVSSVAFPLADGSYAVFSPGRELAGSFEAGSVAALVAGNAFHHVGLPAWMERHPQARVYASELAMPRLRRQGREGLLPLAELQPLLAPGYRLLSVPFIGSGEAIVSVPAADGRAWIVCDLFMNMLEAPPSFLGRLWGSLMDEYPGLKLPRVLAPLIPLGRRGAVADWICNELRADQPTTLVPAHGEVATQSDLTQELARRLQSRFGGTNC